MGSLLFGGVRYAVYSHDHEPAHVHAFYGKKELVLDLLPQGGVILCPFREKDKIVRAYAYSADCETSRDPVAGPMEANTWSEL